MAIDDLRFLHQIRILMRRYLTQGGVGVNVSVTAGATTKAVVFVDGKKEPDTTYGVVVTPSWLTTVGVSLKATTGFTISFGTAAPSPATFDYAIIRSE